MWIITSCKNCPCYTRLFSASTSTNTAHSMFYLQGVYIWSALPSQWPWYVAIIWTVNDEFACYMANNWLGVCLYVTESGAMVVNEVYLYILQCCHIRIWPVSSWDTHYRHPAAHPVSMMSLMQCCMHRPVILQWILLSQFPSFHYFIVIIIRYQKHYVFGLSIHMSFSLSILLIFLILVSFWLRETGQNWGLWIFPS